MNEFLTINNFTGRFPIPFPRNLWVYGESFFWMMFFLIWGICGVCAIMEKVTGVENMWDADKLYRNPCSYYDACFFRGVKPYDD